MTPRPKLQITTATRAALEKKHFASADERFKALVKDVLPVLLGDFGSSFYLLHIDCKRPTEPLLQVSEYSLALLRTRPTSSFAKKSSRSEIAITCRTTT